MCDTGHDHHHEHFGFLIDTPEIRALIDEAQRQMGRDTDNVERVEALQPVFANLLATDGWLPESCAVPDDKSRMGDGIGQYALYDHLAWGLVGVYRGEQDETVYRRLDDASDPARAELEISKQQTLKPGDLYPLIPPMDDIHYVKTISKTASISIHLLANDTACVWRHKFDPASGAVTPFRSGYANAPCETT